MKRFGCAVLLIVCIGFFDSASAKNFTDNGNDTVTDNDTSLIWQKSEGGILSWKAALAYCESLSLGGSSDWRLPDKRELFSLVDVTMSPALSKIFFPGVANYYYWSSTTDAVSPSNAWEVGFGSGTVGYYQKLYAEHVRCVRAGL